MGAYLLPLLVESGMTAYGITSALETRTRIAKGEQTIDPRGWTTDQWVQAIAGGLAGTSGTVMALKRGSVQAMSSTLTKRAAARLALPLYAGYVVHDTVMNPQSDYYISPDTPLLPGRSGPRLFGGDVGSKLLTAASYDLARLLS